MSRKEIIDKIQSKWISRKLLVFLIASIALFLGKLESKDWVIIATIYIAVQGATDIAERLIKARQGISETNQTIE